MEREIIGIYGLLALFVLIMLRIPVALAMFVTGVVGTWVLSLASPFIKFGPYLLQFKTALWNSVANYDLSVVPLFVLMGFLAAETGLSRDLFQGLSALTQKIRGGVAMATGTGVCGFWGGKWLVYRNRIDHEPRCTARTAPLKYNEGLSTGVLAAGGTLGILIPPSVALVIYAIVVEAPIIEMFQAAIVPGLLAVVFFLIVIRVRVARNPDLAPQPIALSPSERTHAIRRLIPVTLIFGAIILGLGMGFFTPTPAAGVGVFLILGYGLLLRRTSDDGLTFGRLKAALLATAKTASMIYFILFSADILKGFFARTGLPASLSDWAAASTLEPYVILILMLLILIILGCFMESLSMILVVVPFFWPVLIELNGGDFVTAETAAFGMTTDDLRIWFGILALIVVELGLITPPVGLNVFVIKSFSPTTNLGVIFRGVAPFFGIELIRVALLLVVPALALYLPRVL
jgi:tripartite ATP-independent transporter DctM subunit